MSLIASSPRNTCRSREGMIKINICATFTNGLNEDGIVTGHDETEPSIVSVDNHHPRRRTGMAGVITTVVTTAANQAAVD